MLKLFLGFLFPNIPKDHPANKYIATNMIAYRSQYGSVNPAAVVEPGIVATMVSALAAVVFCKVINGKRR